MEIIIFLDGQCLLCAGVHRERVLMTDVAPSSFTVKLH